MSEATNNAKASAGSGTPTVTGPDTQADLANQLVADATKAEARYQHDDAAADDWGKASFPASDPPQNY